MRGNILRQGELDANSPSRILNRRINHKGRNYLAIASHTQCNWFAMSGLQVVRHWIEGVKGMAVHSQDEIVCVQSSLFRRRVRDHRFYIDGALQILQEETGLIQF